MSSTQLWFLQELDEIISTNQKKFGIGKNSWYNLLFTSVHIFVAEKYIQREAILQKMKSIYDEEQPSKMGFQLPSKRKQENTLEFGLLREENVEKMRPIRNENQKLNNQLDILRSFLIFLYSIDPRDKIFEDNHLEELETLFEEWLFESTEQLTGSTVKQQQ